MPPALPGSADANNKYEDLSGVDLSASENPYDALINACNDEPTRIQALYSTHRTKRNQQQKEKMLATDFQGLNIDTLLEKLEDSSIEPRFVDPRNCMVFWARPPPSIKDLVDQIQEMLKSLAPNLWQMPIENLHLTALEVTHSLTMPEIDNLVEKMKPMIPTMCNYLLSHRARLIKPFLSYDSSAVALSFLPAADECKRRDATGSGEGKEPGNDHFTYHHLRRDLYNLATSNYTDPKIVIESRYVVPSAHITISRFTTQKDHSTPQALQAWISKIEDINDWLRANHWPNDIPAPRNGPLPLDNKTQPDIEKDTKNNNDEKEETKPRTRCNVQENFTEWIVGQGKKGLDCRRGTLWYGGGETVFLGEGF